MGMRIDEINVKGLGPIVSETLPLNLVNIIYGLNEQGKTLLVEYVTKSLFSIAKIWEVRDVSCRGKVIVSGLPRQDQPLAMSPSFKPKLEHILEEQSAGLPSRISRLMVVKGADLSFDNKNSDEIDSAILKEFLSGEVLLDEIQKRISPAVQKATIADGIITGDQRIRDNKSWTDARSWLNKLDSLFEEIEAMYSSGKLRRLEDRVSAIEEKIEEQEQAKRHEAFLVNQEVTQVNSQLAELPQDKLNEVESVSTLLHSSDNRISGYREDLASYEGQSAHFEWLSQAIDWYERRGLDDRTRPNRLWLIGAITSAVLAMFLSIFSIPATVFGFILLAALFAFLYWRQLEKEADEVLDSDEMARLSEEFERRLDQPFSGLPQMKALKQEMEGAHASAERRRKDLEDETRVRNGYRDKMATLFYQLTGDYPGEEEWPSLLNQLNAKRGSLLSRREELIVRRTELDVPESDYLDQPAGIPYSRTALEGLFNDLKAAQSALEEEKLLHKNLQERVRSTTDCDYSAEWDLLILRLQDKRKDQMVAFREITATILAGHLVNQALEEHRAREQDTIAKGLNSQEVKDALYHITNRYTGAVSDGDHVWAVDQYGQFRISDLSTGAREQVLLGLRIGFLRQIFKQQSLFLLLDDAFQHADYPRRKRLVDLMVKLAQDGWQIIYFTMDDHIRKLFVEAGKKHFPDDYAYHVLKPPADEAVEVG